jgi:ABC-type dipeptide/oligopeptide/nickel transport system permease component
VTIVEYFARRLAFVIPLVLGIVLITFLLVRLGGQEPTGLLAGPMATEAQMNLIRSELGLDKPIFEQFAIYLVNVLQGDLGKSWQSNSPVLDEILIRITASLELLLTSMALGALIGVPVGLRAALRPRGIFDQVSRAISLVSYSVPTYWMALMALFIFFLALGWAPPPMGRIDLAVFPPPTVTGSYFIDSLIAGDLEAAWSALGHLILPVCVFTLIVAAPIIKQTRAICLEVLSSDYIRMARLYGYGRKKVWRMTLRNALVPIVTYIGAELATLLAAVALVELVFSWGGLGQWGLNAILFGDFAAVQGYVLVLALFASIVYLIVDLIVLIAEPRAATR